MFESSMSRVAIQDTALCVFLILFIASSYSSRHSFMTGIYPFKAGLQHGVLGHTDPDCSPLDMTFLPQKLQALGYSTHMVGKWHLGFCNWNCTPTYRGFDSFLGYYNGGEDYYTKKSVSNVGVDFHDGEKPMRDDQYSAFTNSQRVDDIINAHDVSKPLFLYVAFQNVHRPLQVPSHYSDMYPALKTDGRKQLSGMVTVMDEAVGNITKALADKGLANDTVIIFTSDNGGDPRYHGNNYPLRGGKSTLFEGGTKAASFIHGTGLNKTGYIYQGMIHAVDWHPTILGIAGGHAESDIDGLNVWEEIRHGLPSKRTEFVYNIDDSGQFPGSAIRDGDFKLMTGSPGRDIPGWYLPDVEMTNQNITSPPIIGRRDTARTGVINGGNHSNTHWSTSQNNRRTYPDQLYNIKNDPYEQRDLSHLYPAKLIELKARLDFYRRTYVAPRQYPPTTAWNPYNYGGFWSPGWC